MLKLFEYNEKDHKFYVTCNKLVCYIPKRYEDKDYLVITDNVTALGVFTMIVDDKTECGLNLPGMITMVPDLLDQETINEKRYYVVTLHKGSVFNDSNILLQNSHIGYDLWMEFLTQDNRPSFLTYNNIISLYDDVPDCTGLNLPKSHALFELVYSHMFRDKDNPNVQYRYTDMKKEPVVINLHDVSFGTTTTHSRLFGAYDDIGLNAALVNKETKNNELEDVFRQ